MSMFGALSKRFLDMTSSSVSSPPTFMPIIAANSAFSKSLWSREIIFRMENDALSGSGELNAFLRSGSILSIDLDKAKLISLIEGKRDGAKNFVPDFKVMIAFVFLMGEGLKLPISSFKNSIIMLLKFGSLKIFSAEVTT